MSSCWWISAIIQHLDCYTPIPTLLTRIHLHLMSSFTLDSQHQTTRLCHCVVLQQFIIIISELWCSRNVYLVGSLSEQRERIDWSVWSKTINYLECVSKLMKMWIRVFAVLVFKVEKLIEICFEWWSIRAFDFSCDLNRIRIWNYVFISLHSLFRFTRCSSGCRR